MKFNYFEPHYAVSDFAGSYYHFDIPPGGSDLMRAEIPNIRFLLSGDVYWHSTQGFKEFHAPCVVLCGSTMRATPIRFAPGTRLLGIAVTPKGWQRCLRVAMHELSDVVIPLEDVAGRAAHQALDRMLNARTEPELVAAADGFMLDLANRNREPDSVFIDIASQWLLNPDLSGVDTLIDKADLSLRQVERLCKAQFGAPPKRLQRKFRSLHASNKLAWNDAWDWQTAAGPSYHDQSHFIREFKEFIGSTPGQFIQGQNILVRMTLMQRLSIQHTSAFSLIA